MIKFFCDKCGREITDIGTYQIKIAGCGNGFKLTYKGMPYDHPPIREFELCGECAAEAAEFMMKKRQQ